MLQTLGLRAAPYPDAPAPLPVGGASGAIELDEGAFLLGAADAGGDLRLKV